MASRKKNSKQDIKHLRTVAGKMLSRLEQELDQEPPKSPMEVEFRQKVHDWLFGAKTPSVAILGSLADLMLKLAQDEDGGGKETRDTPGLTPADITLIEEFARKTQNR